MISISKDVKKIIEHGKEIVLATCSKSGIPRTIVVTSLGFYKDKLLIGICQMKISFENLKQNPNVSLLAMKKDKYYLRINGISEIYNKGEYFDIAIEKSKKHPPLPHHVLVINIQKIFDVDKLKRIL